MSQDPLKRSVPLSIEANESDPLAIVPSGERGLSLPVIEDSGRLRLPSTEHWSAELKEGARSLDDLVRLGHLTEQEALTLKPVTDRFEMLVSRYYLSLIDANDPNCPIRLQALPAIDEAQLHPTERLDPIGDHAHSPVKGVVHRYRNRVLFFPTFRCPMFCRYCFRKVTLNGDPIRLREHQPAALQYIREHSEIQEVILSGGDPLMLSNRRLNELFDAIWQIPHIRKLRVHSRFPVTLPQRIDADLVSSMTRSGPVTLVTHFNHPRELTSASFEAIAMLSAGGVKLFNQAVLLRRVNDDPQILADLFSRLENVGVTPYYLHHLDAAPGTDKFRLSVPEGLSIYRAACALMTAQTLPKYVLDIPGGGGKIPLDSDAVRSLEAPGQYELTSPVDGRAIHWTDPAVG
jgi:lysine 2,3-aminomutase